MEPSLTAKLEQLEYTSTMEQKRAEMEVKIKEIKADATRRGLLSSGFVNGRICEEWEAYCRDLILTRVQLRRRFGVRDAALVTDEAPHQHSTITVNVNNSVIAALNLNSVVQDVTATVNALHSAGNNTIAEALKALTEAVGNDEALGDRRREILEALSGLGEQAKLQRENRKLGVVKPLFETVRNVLTMTASTATIWHQWGPQIQQFFGF